MDAQLSPTPQKCKRGRPTGFKLSSGHRLNMEYHKMLDLWVRGVATADIARVLDRNVQTIHERLLRYRALFPQLENLNRCGERKAFVFKAITAEVLKSMTEEERLSKVGIRQMAHVFEVINSARLAERNC